MFVIMSGVLLSWCERKFGIDIDGTFVCHFIWVDNIWLFASTQAELITMVAELTIAFGKFKLHWELDSLMVMASGEETAGLEFFDIKKHCFLLIVPVLEIDIFGTKISTICSNETTVEHVLFKAARALHADKQYLCCKAVPLNLRFAKYSKEIVPVALHGSASTRQGRLEALQEEAASQRIEISMTRMLEWRVQFANLW